jgi:hypothetical protein
VATEFTVAVPIGKTPEAGVETTVTEQLSVAPTVKFTGASQSPGVVFTVISEGQLMDGCSLSFTMTLKEHDEELPELSVDTEVTVVIPRGKKDPEAGVETTFVVQLSDELIKKVTIAPHAPKSEFTVIFPGQLINGNWLSTTVTLKEQVEVLPWGSVAIEFTVVVPIGKTDPEAGVETILEVQLFVAVTVKFTVAPQTPAFEFTVMSAGQ